MDTFLEWAKVVLGNDSGVGAISISTTDGRLRIAYGDTMSEHVWIFPLDEPEQVVIKRIVETPEGE